MPSAINADGSNLGEPVTLPQDPNEVRRQWIAERVAEFQADPAERDRAIATILYGSMMLDERLGELASRVRQEGIGGLLKSLMGAMRSGGS